MESYKVRFIQLAERKGAFTRRPTRAERDSPYYFDSSVLSDGESAHILGEVFTDALFREGIGPKDFDVIIGPPYKGIPLAGYMLPYLFNRGYNKRAASYRREEKERLWREGISGLTKAELKRLLVVGDLRDKDKYVVADNAMSTGGTKYETIEVVNAVVDEAKPVAFVIGLDRQEVDEQGQNSVEVLRRTTGAKVIVVAMVSDWIDYRTARNLFKEGEREESMEYLRRWGTPEVKAHFKL